MMKKQTQLRWGIALLVLTVAFSIAAISTLVYKAPVANAEIDATEHIFEAEAAEIDFGSTAISIGLDNKTIEQTNNPSGGAFIYGLNGKSTGTLTYKIYSSGETTANVQLRMGSFGAGSGTRKLSVVFNKLTVNGTDYNVGTEITDYTFTAAGSGKFYEWSYIDFGTGITLNRGLNILVINRPAGSNAINFDAVKLSTTDTVTLAQYKDPVSIEEYQLSVVGGANWKTTNANGNASGGYYGNNIGKTAATFTFGVNAAEAGYARISAWFAVNSAANAKNLNTMVNYVLVNGEQIDVSDTAVAVNTGSYTVWAENVLVETDLEEGFNYITLNYPGGSAVNFYNLDRVTVTSTSDVTYFAAVNLQAENAVRKNPSGDTVTGTNTWDGTVTIKTPTANGTITFDYTASQKTTVDLYVRFGSYGVASGARPITNIFSKITVSATVDEVAKSCEYPFGTQLTNHTFTGAGAGVYDVFSIIPIGQIVLYEGTNSIVFQKTSKADWINMDCMYIVDSGAFTPIEYKGDTTGFVAEDVYGNYHVENEVETTYSVAATVPDGWEVSYDGNGLSTAGTKTVTVTYSHDVFADIEKTATITVYYANVEGASLSLTGKISLNFSVDVTEQTYADGTYVLTMDGDELGSGELSAVEQKDGDYYVITALVAAKDYDKTVTLTINTENTVNVETFEYKVADYIKFIADYSGDNAEYNKAKTMVAALNNYCESARAYFNGETVSEEDYTSVIASLADYAPEKIDSTDSEEKVILKGTTLVLESETSLRVYFQIQPTGSIADVTTHTVDGKTVDIQSRVIDEKTWYYLEVADINARNLDTEYTFVIGGYTIKYSALSYAYTTLKSSTETGLLNAVKALYLYSVAAEVYFA